VRDVPREVPRAELEYVEARLSELPGLRVADCPYVLSRRSLRSAP